jgi:membrane-associated phospholipid phosphatase
MPNNSSDSRRFFLPAFLLLAAIAALAIDVPVSLQLRRWSDKASPTYSKTIDAALDSLDRFETFGHGFGVVVILVVLHQLDRARRWALPRLVACSFGAGLAANIVKLIIARTRPYELPLTFDGSVWATFRQWFPMLNNPCGLQSFPSAHTATAAGLAAALIWLYPQGRFLFVLLTILVGCQRVMSRAHYASDVFVGATLGCLVATLVLYVGRLPEWFNRRESNWRTK